jgi:adenylate cyclase
VAIADDLATEVDSILATTWDVTDGTVIPATDDIRLEGGGRRLEVAMLYADLADSTALVSYNRLMSANVFKTFLACCTRLIRHNRGEIRSFDGDRVMGVYIGNAKHSSAGKTALQIKWTFDSILKPKLHAQYETLRDGTLTLGYSAGIDTGDVLVVRAGIRGSNDLLFVGRVANIAAKLSGIRQTPYRSFITEAAYNRLREDVKLGRKARKCGSGAIHGEMPG